MGMYILALYGQGSIPGHIFWGGNIHNKGCGGSDPLVKKFVFSQIDSDEIWEVYKSHFWTCSLCPIHNKNVHVSGIIHGCTCI